MLKRMFWCFLCFAIVLCFLKTWRSTDTRRLCFRHWYFKSDFAWCLVLISSPKNVIWLWKKNWQNWPKIKCTPLCISLFHMKIMVSVIKSLYQDCGTCYLHLPAIFFNIHSPLLLENKVVEMLFSSAN